MFWSIPINKLSRSASEMLEKFKFFGVARIDRGLRTIDHPCFQLSLMASSSSNTSGPSLLRLKILVIGGGIAGDYLYSMGRVIFWISCSRARNCFYTPESWSQCYRFGEKEWKDDGLSFVSCYSFCLYTHQAYRVLRRAVLFGKYL